MLKFNSWPPEAGEMEWTEGALNGINTTEGGEQVGKAWEQEYDEIQKLAQRVGGLLAANMDNPSLSNVELAARDLSKNWGKTSRGAFVDQTVAGAAFVYRKQGVTA